MSPEFNYTARNQEGSTVTGSLEGDSREEIARRLRQRGLYVTSLEEQEESSSGIFTRELDLSSIKFWDKGFDIAQLAHFSKQFSVLIDAGIPLVQALEIMIEQTQQQNVEEMLTEVRSTVEAGEPFSQALSNHPDFFPPLFVNLVKAGETGGVLDEVLEELSQYYKRRDRINKEVKGSLYYPIILVVVAVIVIMILLTFVLPTITDMLVGLGGDLPLPTLILITVSNFLNNFWWAVFGGLAAIIAGLFYYFRTDEGKQFKDRMIFRLPVIGDLMRKLIISRMANTLALLLDSGVNIVNALPVLEDVVGNEVIKDVLIETRARVREGEELSAPLERSDEFPPIVIQMIRVGEETGDLDGMLRRLSDYYEVEVENAIEGGISLIEPVIIIFMAVIVGGIVASVILPMFDIYTQI